MRRIAGLAFGLMLVAGTVQAQAVKCTSSKTTRLGAKGAQFVSGVLKGWYVSSDSVAYTCTGFPAARVDTVTVPGPVVHDTVWVRDSTPVPPTDTMPTPPPPPPADTTPAAGVLWSSDWRTLGATDAALTDGSTWTDHWAPCPGGVLDIVPATGRGFPTANVLRVRMGQAVSGGTNCEWIQAHNKWALPPVGGAVAFRIYLRHEVADADGDKGSAWAATHPVESGYSSGTGGGYWEWKLASNSNGTFPLFFETSGAQFTLGKAPSPSTPPALPKFTTYRLEWKLLRRGTNLYDLEIRVYGQDGALLFDAASVYRWGGGTIASGAGKGLNIEDAQVRNFRVGINGGFPTGSPQYVYYGAAAVCADWCGAY